MITFFGSASQSIDYVTFLKNCNDHIETLSWDTQSAFQKNQDKLIKKQCSETDAGLMMTENRKSAFCENVLTIHEDNWLKLSEKCCRCELWRIYLEIFITMNSFNDLKNSSFLITFVIEWHFGVLLKVTFSWDRLH